MRRLLPWAVLALAVAVWAGPLQWGPWSDITITDIPTYREVAHRIGDGQVPYQDFPLEYPPLAAGLFWVAGALPGPYAVGFSILMLACLCATALGVMATARALGLERRREALAGGVVALSPLLLGNLVQTRFDLLLAALLAWTLYAAVAGRWRLCWGLLGLATLVKLIPLVLAPVLLIFARHRVGARRAWAGLAGGLGVVALGLAPFALLSATGLWRMVEYHVDRPLQIESSGAAYLLGLHALADIRLEVVSSFGSQGLAGDGPRVLAIVWSAALLVALAAVAVTFALLVRRARPPADARLLLAASAATLGALLAGGKVLSPQFLVWLLPAGLLVAGRHGAGAFAGTVGVLVLTQAYFPDRYWDLVALHDGPIALLVLRDAALVVLVALAWPRPGVAPGAAGTLPRRTTPAPAGARQSAVAGRYLVD